MLDVILFILAFFLINSPVNADEGWHLKSAKQKEKNLFYLKEKELAVTVVQDMHCGIKVYSYKNGDQEENLGNVK